MEKVNLLKAVTLTVLTGILVRTAAAADPLDTWHPRTSPTNGGLNSITFANGRFVAVGDRIGPSGSRLAFTISSADGIDWTFHPTDVDRDLSGVAFGNDTFVAIGYGGRAATSPDGITWTRQETDTSANFNSVRFLNGHFVASGDSGRILVSTSGTGWTEYTTPSSNYWNDATYLAGKYVFVGWDYKTGTARYGVTPDFQSWETGYTGYGRYLDRVLTLDNKLLAVGYGGVAQRSSDGIQWDPVEDASTRWLFDAAFGNGILGSVGESGSIATFVPSTGWVRRTSGTTESLRSVAFGLDTFVAVGDEGIILQSAPLVVPTSEVTLTAPFRSGDKFSFDLIGEVGQTYQIQATSDFSTWTPVLTVACQTSRMPCTISGQNLTWQAYRAQKP